MLSRFNFGLIDDLNDSSNQSVFCFDREKLVKNIIYLLNMLNYRMFGKNLLNAIYSKIVNTLIVICSQFKQNGELKTIK